VQHISALSLRKSSSAFKAIGKAQENVFFFVSNYFPVCVIFFLFGKEKLPTKLKHLDFDITL
jgi:hypothetical protein